VKLMFKFSNTKLLQWKFHCDS